MKILFATNELDSASLEQCSLVLREGGILCYPTETFYALGIDPWNEVARRRLYEAKQRHEEKQFPLIIADGMMLDTFCRVDHPGLQQLAARFWPGPLTIVLPSRIGPETYAVRVSSEPIARQLSACFNGPIVSTSANVSGQSAVAHPDALPEELTRYIDILIHRGVTKGEKLSTIVSLVEDPPKILREGAIPSDEVFATL